MIQEIMAHHNEESLEVSFRRDSGDFDKEILETIETPGCRL